MSDLAAEVAALTKRLQQLEDQQEIVQLIATYGPAVDSLSGDAVIDLWTEDGVYDVGGMAPFIGSEVVDVVEAAMHRQYVSAGCAHVQGLPLVHLDGDRAVATSVSRVYVRDGDQWRVERVSANRWELVRTPQGWRATYRVNRLLNGSPEAQELLRSGLAPGVHPTD